MIPVKHFYMIRHGETEANAASIMAGSLDSPLTKKGREQAAVARDIVAQLREKPLMIIHSHLSRARDTAKIINEALHVPMVEDPDFAELYVGDWEGMAYGLIPEMFNSWPDNHGGETHKDFFERVRRGKKRVLDAYENPVLIVCHGGVMRAFGELYGISTPPAFRNAHLYEFIPSSDAAQKFPWDAWHYDLDDNKKLHRTKAEIFSLQDSASNTAKA